MSLLKNLSLFIGLFAILFTIGFNYVIEIQYYSCLLANVGYLDFMGLSYNNYWEKCVADASEAFLKRDYEEGSGTITKIREVDCSNGMTFEQMREESHGFTRPFICRGLLKENKCLNWNLDYFTEIAKEDEWLRLLDLGNQTYDRKAFTTNYFPQIMETGPETFKR